MKHELDKREQCPCGSGLKYGGCCKKRKIRYDVDDKGEIFQSIPLHPELESELKDSEKRFREIFGRKWGRRDRVLFDQYLSDSDDYWNGVIKIARSANVGEEVIFATRRTEFFLTSENKRHVPDVRQEEWAEAIEEYFAIKKKGYDPFYVFSPLLPKQYEYYKKLVELIGATIIVASSSIDDRKQIKGDPEFFQFFFISRALGSLRTIREMFDDCYDDDCLSVLRGVYESYLRAKLLRLRPEDSEKFIGLAMRGLGLAKVFVTKKGKLDRNRIIQHDGKIVDIAVSNSYIIERSDFVHEEELYHEVYPQLSGFVHPDVAHFVRHISTDGNVDIYRKNDPYRAIVLVALVSVLLLNETSRCAFVLKTRASDIRRCKSKIARALKRYLDFKNELAVEFGNVRHFLSSF